MLAEPVRLLGELAHGLAARAAVAPDLLDEARDVGSGHRRALGEFSHFVGHYGEAAPLLSRARRLDRGVERQEIRLIGDLADEVDDAGDLLRPRIERADFLRRALGALGELAQALGDRLGRFAAHFGTFEGLLGGFPVFVAALRQGADTTLHLDKRGVKRLEFLAHTAHGVALPAAAIGFGLGFFELAAQGGEFALLAPDLFFQGVGAGFERAQALFVAEQHGALLVRFGHDIYYGKVGAGLEEK